MLLGTAIFCGEQVVICYMGNFQRDCKKKKIINFARIARLIHQYNLKL